MGLTEGPRIRYGSVIRNLINGNLKDAQAGAKGVSPTLLKQAYVEVTGFSTRAADAAVDYLKGVTAFQVYADIEFEEKNKK